MEKTANIKKLPLSILILTNRSDERFVAALASAQFAADILVIAHGVEKAVAALRPRYDFQVLPWDEPITDFSYVRNSVLQHAQHDWVLFLDSDEVVSPASISEIEYFITQQPALGVGVRRSDIFHGKQLEYGEAGNQLVVRLGKKDALTFTGTVHEVASVAGKVVPSTIEILHYSHPTITEFIHKVSEYSQQVAAERPTTFQRLLFELLVYPPAKFLYGLFIQGGIIDGWPGIVYAATMSLHSLLVRIYQYEKHIQKAH